LFLISGAFSPVFHDLSKAIPPIVGKADSDYSIFFLLYVPFAHQSAPAMHFRIFKETTGIDVAHRVFILLF